MNEVYANAVLKDGKLIFWYTGDKVKDICDFNKDFVCAGLNMMAELEKHNYTIVNKKMETTGNEAFLEEAPEFYKQFELCEGYKGEKPY